MDYSIIALSVALAAAVCLLRPRDIIPMLVNLLLIAGGTIGLLWLMDNPEQAVSVRAKATEWGWGALLLLASQPVVFLAAKWLAKRLPNGKSK